MLRKPRLKDSLWVLPIALIISAFLHQHGVGAQWSFLNFVMPHAVFSVLAYFGTFWLVSSVAKRLRNRKPNDCGTYYLGEGFGKGQRLVTPAAFGPDINGKIYRFFRLVDEGEHKGKYYPTLVTRLGPTSEEVKRSEAKDILESGFEIYAMNSSKDAFETYQLPEEFLTRQ